MRATCLSILVMISLMLAGCHRDQPHALSAQTQLKPGFSGWIATDGVCYLRYYNDTAGAVLINHYLFGYHISGTDNEATRFFEYKVPKPMDKDWALVAPHAHLDFSIAAAACSGKKSAQLDPCSSYTVELYTPSDEPPKRLLGMGVTVIRPEGNILIQP